jgi:hypothetical protein
MEGAYQRWYAPFLCLVDDDGTMAKLGFSGALEIHSELRSC